MAPKRKVAKRGEEKVKYTKDVTKEPDGTTVVTETTEKVTTHLVKKAKKIKDGKKVVKKATGATSKAAATMEPRLPPPSPSKGAKRKVAVSPGGGSAVKKPPGSPSVAKKKAATEPKKPGSLVKKTHGEDMGKAPTIITTKPPGDAKLSTAKPPGPIKSPGVTAAIKPPGTIKSPGATAVTKPPGATAAMKPPGATAATKPPGATASKKPSGERTLGKVVIHKTPTPPGTPKGDQGLPTPESSSSSGQRKAEAKKPSPVAPPKNKPPPPANLLSVKQPSSPDLQPVSPPPPKKAEVQPKFKLAEGANAKDFPEPPPGYTPEPGVRKSPAAAPGSKPPGYVPPGAKPTPFSEAGLTPKAFKASSSPPKKPKEFSSDRPVRQETKLTPKPPGHFSKTVSPKIFPPGESPTVGTPTASSSSKEHSLESLPAKRQSAVSFSADASDQMSGGKRGEPRGQSGESSRGDTKGEYRGPSPRGEPRSPSPKGEPRGPSPRGEPRGPSPRGESRGPSPRGEPRGPSPKGEARSPSPRGEPRSPSRDEPKNEIPKSQSSLKEQSEDETSSAKEGLLSQLDSGVKKERKTAVSRERKTAVSRELTQLERIGCSCRLPPHDRRRCIICMGLSFDDCPLLPL